MKPNVVSKFTAVATLLLWPLVISLPYDHLDDQVNAAIDAGTFQNPSSNIRPKFRYWLPDASVNVTLLADDIATIASVGAGTIEFLNYWLYGGAAVTQPFVPVNWDTFNFGTPAYNEVLIAALQACKDNGILMDYEVGVQSGQGAPAEAGNPGLAWFLNSAFDIISPGGNFTGPIPSVSGELVAVVTAEVLIQQAEDGFTLYTVTETSLQDITSQVSGGTLNLTFPANSTAQGFLVYASYAVQPLVRSGAAGPDPQTVIQNGSFAVDHFSPVGAKVTTDFLEQFVLINGAKELIEEVGNYIWEDSIEIQGPGAYWTPNFTAEFEAQHGYSFLPFLPLVARLNENAEGTQSTFSFQTSSADSGASYINDFRATLTAGYHDYLIHWTKWSNSYLNLQSSAQVGYNLPVDALSQVPFTNAPEGETLAFVNDVDEFRQYAEAGNLAGKRVISIELAADRHLTYQLTFPTLLQNAARAISGGVNTFVIHGSPYSHFYPNTTWPGYTTFNFEFSEMHGRHQPAWENGYRGVLDWFARSSFVLQSGIPKRDVVFYEKLTTPLDEPSFPKNYQPNDLVDAGYTYGYLSPDNFQLPQAIVTDGVLALDGPSYKALILRQNDTLTVDGVSKIAEFANAGLPIIAAGGFPPFFSPQNATAVAFVNTTLTSISTLPNVHITADIPVAFILQSIGIVPRTQVSTNSTWEISWRDNSTGSFVFIFNDGGDSVGSIKFASTAAPYLWDAWTGVQSAILNYTLDATDGTTEIAIELKANQTIMLAFSNDTIPGVEVPPTHFTSAPSSVLGFSYSNSTGLVAKIPSSSTNTTGILTTSDGQQHTFSGSDVPAAFQLTNWSLIAEHWDPPSNISDLEIVAVKSNTTHTNLTYPLLDWNSIPGLANTSGLGFYTSTFTWPPASSSSSLGAILSFKTPIIHTLTLTVNSQLLPPIDPRDPTVDISALITNGTNVVEAKIATVIYNALVPILTELRTAASGLGLPLDEYPAFVEVGLAGEVVVTPFGEFAV